MPTTSPLSVTRRYASNLLRDGSNSDYRIEELKREPSKIEDHVVGYYYGLTLSKIDYIGSWIAFGATPLQALERALTKAGVTFR